MAFRIHPAQKLQFELATERLLRQAMKSLIEKVSPNLRRHLEAGYEPLPDPDPELQRANPWMGKLPVEEPLDQFIADCQQAAIEIGVLQSQDRAVLTGALVGVELHEDKRPELIEGIGRILSIEEEGAVVRLSLLFNHLDRLARQGDIVAAEIAGQMRALKEVA